MLGTPLPRRRPAARARLQAPGAPGHVRRRDDGDQQRGLDPAARRRARGVGAPAGRSLRPRPRPRRGRLDQAAAAISAQPARILSPGARKFLAGIEELGLEDHARRYAPVDANIHQLPRLRLLQHRLCLRPQALDARHAAPVGPGAVRRRAAADRRRDARRGDRGRRRPGGGDPLQGGRPPLPGPRRALRRRRRRGQLVLPARPVRDRRAAGRPRPLVQRRLADHRRVRREARLLRRAADLARLRAARRRPRRGHGDLVQPGRLAVARDARLVRAAPPQHARLRPDGGDRGPDRQRVRTARSRRRCSVAPTSSTSRRPPTSSGSSRG